MALTTVKVTADKIKKRKKRLKRTKIVIIVLFLLLLSFFVILSLVYKGGRFTITLDPNFNLKSGIVLYENKVDKQVQRHLYAEEVDFMDNISIKWLPENIDSEGDGSHNGDNYIAYTFYLENGGTETIHYWYEIEILDAIKNVDSAVRIMVFLNGEKTVYAKINQDTNEPEIDTKPFYSDKIAVLEQRENFNPNDVDKFTVVIWLEGDDPDCINAIIGGEIKMKMNITEEHIEQGG